MSEADQYDQHKKTTVKPSNYHCPEKAKFIRELMKKLNESEKENSEKKRPKK